MRQTQKCDMEKPVNVIPTPHPLLIPESPKTIHTSSLTQNLEFRIPTIPEEVHLWYMVTEHAVVSEKNPTTNQVTRTPLKPGNDHMCSGRVRHSCSTSGTRHVTFHYMDDYA